MKWEGKIQGIIDFSSIRKIVIPKIILGVGVDSKESEYEQNFLIRKDIRNVTLDIAKVSEMSLEFRRTMVLFLSKALIRHGIGTLIGGGSEI